MGVRRQELELCRLALEQHRQELGQGPEQSRPVQELNMRELERRRQEQGHRRQEHRRKEQERRILDVS